MKPAPFLALSWLAASAAFAGPFDQPWAMVESGAV